MISRSKQDKLPSKPNPGDTHHRDLPSPKTEGNPSLRWLILDGQKLALSHGCGQISYEGIALAVQYFSDMGHRNLIVCVPECMKTHEYLPYHDYHYLTELKDHLTIIFMPSEDKGPSWMDALARKMDALIITQLGPDTWSESRTRILQFTYFNNSFMLPDDPWGKKGPDLDTLLRSKNTLKLSVQNQVKDLMMKWERFSKLVNEPLNLSLSEEPGYTTAKRYIIIDGSNVAMSHGLDTFYSCHGIYLAVYYFWTDGYRNIIVCVPNWRHNSRNTVYGYEYLDRLYKKGLVTFTPSRCYDDRLMLKEAKNKNGLIVTNDKFRDFGQEWKDVINERIPFKFDGNQFIASPKGSEAVGKSSVRPPGSG